MRSARHLVRALPAVAAAIALCGCSARPRPEDATLNIYPLMHGSESNKTLSVAIEIRNVSRRSITFIAPQEASQCGWQEPKYLFAVTNDQGKIYPPCNGFYDPPETIYNESTIISLAPGESLYAYEDLYGVKGTNSFTISLTYSCDKIDELPKWWNGKRRGWPGNLFFGTLQSSVVTANMSVPLPEKGPFVMANVRTPDGFSRRRNEENLAVHLSTFMAKYQEWSPVVCWIAIENGTGRQFTSNEWALGFNWYDVNGKKAPTYVYSTWGWRLGMYPDLPSVIQDYPIGFQKKAGSYRVSVDLLLKGKRMATSNFIDIDIVPNPLLAEPSTNAAPGGAAGGR